MAHLALKLRDPALVSCCGAYAKGGGDRGDASSASTSPFWPYERWPSSSPFALRGRYRPQGAKSGPRHAGAVRGTRIDLKDVPGILEGINRPHAEAVFDEIANQLGSDDPDVARRFLRRRHTEQT